MERDSGLLELASGFWACRDIDSLLKAFVTQLGTRLDAQTVLVWLLDDAKEKLVCRGRWSAPGMRLETEVESVGKGFLMDLLEVARPRSLREDEIGPTALLHLKKEDRERVKTAVYAPLLASGGVAGVVEVLNKHSGEFTAADTSFAEEASRLTAAALDSLQGLEEERLSTTAAIQRLTALWDISRVFNSTLELEDLMPIVAKKICDILGAQACNLWLVDSGARDVYLAQQAGEDLTAKDGERLALGEGVIGAVVQQGEARLVADAREEPLLASRRERSREFGIKTLMCAPLQKEEEVLGAVEVVNKLDETPFDENDLFFLTTVSEQAAIALNNANLLEAERKVHELDALLAISKEITSTLNLDHVLATVVNQAGTVLPFARCTIGLFERGKFTLNSVSGMEAVPKSEEMESLRELLEWVASSDQPVSADKEEGGWIVEPEAGRELLVPYLERAGYRGFYALPLSDEEGTLGAIALENSEEHFLGPNHLEVLSILTSQTTVAVRNAQLYQQVPLINVMQPLLERKARLLALPRARLSRLGMQALVVALILVVVPWKLRIGTNATVVPAERRVVAAEVPGVIQRVLVREGDLVTAGSVLAELDSSDDRVLLERAQSDFDLARRQLAENEARGDLGAASQARLQMEMHQAEVNLYGEKVAKAQLRARVSGVVVTAKVEEKVGKRLAQGEEFCEVVPLERMAVEMNVPETQVDLIRPGTHVSLKLNAFPARTFAGTIERVGAQAVPIEGDEYFVVRAVFANPDRAARTGMVGRAKIVAGGGWGGSGWYPIGYVIARSPVRWVWRKAWSWLP